MTGPTEQDVRDYFHTLSNWGRWGEDDRVREYVGIVGHGSHTHLDGLAHFSWEGKNYNGFDAADTTSVGGATKLSVHQAKEGIISREVLLDVPAAKGVPWLDAGYTITPDDLRAAEQRQNVSVEASDVLLVHTGHFARLASHGPDRPKGVNTAQPGLGAACLPFLHERDVAVLGSDGIQDVQPSGFDAMDLYMPIHAVTLVAMGLWLIDNVELTELAATCAAKQRWEFFFSMLPWRLVGVTSSATNPIAMF